MMMRESDHPKNFERIFVDSDDASDLRARRVWRFVNVMWATWLFFAVYLYYRGYAASVTCAVNAIAIGIMNLVGRERWTAREVMSSNLIFSAIGLFFVSLSDSAMHTTMLFYPVSILVASQLFGIRTALAWTIVTCGSFILFNVLVYGFHQTFTESLFDHLILQLGVALCTFFCCQQGEEYYHKRTWALIRLSQDLANQSTHLEKLATTDALTGLMNRFQFQNQLRETIELAKQNSTRTVLYMIDMNGFKEINDTMGHLVGDEALIQIGSRLAKEFGAVYDVARLGGDEFCVIAGHEITDAEAKSVAERICELLSYRYRDGEIEFPLGASVGYCVFPDQASNDKDLFAFADTAMYFAKENQAGYALYDKSMTERLIEQRLIQDKLSNALLRDEFFLVYQPQVDISTGLVIGVEALLRWKSEGEIIPPNRFIPVLERGGEIRAVGRWIIREACRQWAVWKAEGLTTTVSINVSAVQFKDPDFIRSIEESINEFGVTPSDLDFEITEGLLIDDVAEAVKKLKLIKQLGSTISIDDFGTGYSSLAYLRHFPIDRLKIDRAFVKDYPNNDDGVIASSIIVLAKTLGLQVLAEGVERQDQLDFLKLHDCQEYQGFLFSRPIAPEDVAFYLQRKNGPIEKGTEARAVTPVKANGLLGSEKTLAR